MDEPRGPVNASPAGGTRPFVHPSPYCYNIRDPKERRRPGMPDVTIDWNAGRTQEQKDKIAKVIENALVEIGKAPRENVKITFKDNPV